MVKSIKTTHKSGSHRGSAKVKKGKFTRGEKKKPKSVLEKLRELIAVAIKAAEENSKFLSYVHTNFKCKDLADKFKCRIGEVAKAVEILYHEGLTSSITKRFMSFSIIFNEHRHEEERSIEPYFSYNRCPVCEAELSKKEGKRKIKAKNEDGEWYVKHQILVSLILICKNGCFLYDASSGVHKIEVFDESIIIIPTAHKSIINHKIKIAKKEILRVKKNERYLTKILIKDL